MKIVVISMALVVFAVSLAVLYLKHRMRNPDDSKNLEAAVDAKLIQFMRKKLHLAVVVGVYRDGRSFVRGYGTVRTEAPVLPDATTAFQIGSVSKIFTATLLQTLCDEGVVSMETTLNELLGGSIPLSPAAQGVTLKQLVTHTSGFPSVPKSLELKATELAGKEELMGNPYSYLGPEFVFDYLATTEGTRKPGRFEYSNLGMGLLGHVLEHVTGRDYESLVREKVLAPLGMNETVITLTPDIEDRLTRGYTAKGEPAGIWTFAALAGAGAYISSAKDMLRFIEACLGEQGSASQQFDAMRRPQSEGVTGIGWMQPTFLDRFLGNRKVVWHNGMVGGYASYLSIDAETRTGVVILTNQARATRLLMLGIGLMRQVRTQS
ncbi:CubicO group peptidase, beta-lactamase class C family [Alkalispirochaeta americana]|uniref:CubicO group peptidase, beta-lactamase class C family n=1 Tax=Alkalispirochaeta americana TaxID=159291 RepID=A0A1N6WWS8_9SPIO|nr:serine hydrolase domain-containing protein [Alkalispirochaeta americana]SIQ94549.1 CubicO group peptidase, beta-lactamase class C family [Alkalispirochaeta americana]